MRRNLILLCIFLLTYLVNLLTASPRMNRKDSGRAAITDVATSSSDFRIPASGSAALVTRIIDGDTIEIAGGIKVRYIGIDTPETVHPDKSVQCFGREASLENTRLVKGQTVTLVRDVSETDRYGRLLRYVYVGDLFVNDYLVREGYARVSTYPPDVAHAAQFLLAEREARESERGLWSGCRVP